MGIPTNRAPGPRRPTVSKAIRIVAGIDIGDRTSHVYAVDIETGEVVADHAISTEAAALEGLFARWRDVRVALEVGSHSPWISELLDGLGHEVLVANPRKLRCIYAGTNKQDRLDAQKLSFLAKAEPKLLYPIRHRSRETREDLAILRGRAHLVRMRGQLTTAIRGIVKSHGGRIPSGTTPYFVVAATPHIPAGLKRALEPLLATVADLTVRIDAYDRAVQAMAREKYPETAALRQVQGVGWLTSLDFVLTLEDPSRFRKSRDVGPALGLVPRRDQSGGMDRQLPITKTGDVYLRCLLVEAAQCILRRGTPDSDLKRWGRKQARRGGKSGKKRTLIGVARRLAVLLHRLWVTQAVYDPLYGAKKTVVTKAA